MIIKTLTDTIQRNPSMWGITCSGSDVSSSTLAP